MTCTAKVRTFLKSAILRWKFSLPDGQRCRCPINELIFHLLHFSIETVTGAMKSRPTCSTIPAKPLQVPTCFIRVCPPDIVHFLKSTVVVTLWISPIEYIHDCPAPLNRCAEFWPFQCTTVAKTRQMNRFWIPLYTKTTPKPYSGATELNYIPKLKTTGILRWALPCRTYHQIIHIKAIWVTGTT